jgi:hypothetical protein
MKSKNVSYSGGEILSWQEDHILARNSKGEYCKIPHPKFHDRQFVKTRDGFYSPADFTRVLHPTYTETRGWVYGQQYINRDGIGGGSGWSWDEADFLPLKDPRDILIARRISILEDSRDLELHLKRNQAELEKIHYALELTQPKKLQLNTNP